MRTIYIGNQVQEKKSAAHSFSYAMLQAEAAFLNILLSICYLVEGFYTREKGLYEYDFIKIHDYQILSMLKKLVKYQETLLQKQNRLKCIFPQEYQTIFTSEKDIEYEELMVKRTSEILNFIKNQSIANEIYLEEIKTNLAVLINGIIQMENIPSNIEESEDKRTAPPISVNILNTKKGKTGPWLAEGISKGKKNKK